MNEQKSCCMTKPVVEAPVEKTAKPVMLKAYVPLIAMSAVSLAMALVLRGAWGLPFMAAFMGIWLVQFSLVKLFDLEGFVERFAKYDLLTARVRGYGYAFPFIELALGLAYLGMFLPMLTSVALLVVAALTLSGIVVNYNKRGDMACACMGASVNVPLSFVAAAENGLMIVMALGILFRFF